MRRLNREPSEIARETPHAKKACCGGTHDRATGNSRWSRAIQAVACPPIAALTAILGGAVSHLLHGISHAMRAGPEAGRAGTFVGSAACAGCRADEVELWRTSQHARAMQHASDRTVLGDFNDARLEHFGKQHEDALGDLRRAAELAPDQLRYAYVYAVGLHSAGQASEALAVLKDTLSRHPNNRATLSDLINVSRNAGDFAIALAYAGQRARVTPADPRLSALIESLRRNGDGPDARRRARIRGSRGRVSRGWILAACGYRKSPSQCPGACGGGTHPTVSSLSIRGRAEQ